MKPNAVAKPVRPTPPEKALCKILVFRPIAIKLMSVLSKAEPDVLAISDLIASDPGFTAEILTASNSAAFARQSRVDTVQKAVMVLGTEHTWKLVARTALQGMVQGMENDLSVENCWVHSRASAALATWLAPQYQIHPDRAYTLALMHDIGRLGLLSVHGRRYAEILERVSGTNATMMDAERILFSMDHCEAGEWLAKTCGLPPEFQETAGAHHCAVQGLARDSIDLVACACAMAQALGFRAAPQVEGESLEVLLERAPAGPHLATQFSANDLSYFIGKELEL